MSGARWIEIDKAVASATGNFAHGVEFARHASFQVDDLIGLAILHLPNPLILTMICFVKGADHGKRTQQAVFPR